MRSLEKALRGRILSLDTTGEFGGLAAIEEDRVVEEIPLHSPEGFAHVLFSHLEVLLGRLGWTLNEIDCFAAASGPGSFTGVRVGLAAMKGLAEAVGRPVVGVSNLEALAWYGSAEFRAPVLDARRGEIYGAVYNRDLLAVRPETVSRLNDFLAGILEREVEFLSPSFAPFRAALAGTRFAGARITETPRAMAGVIGRIAGRRLAVGEAGDPVSLDANYVRRADAEVKWRDRLE